MAKKIKGYCDKCKQDVELDDCREVDIERNKKLFSGTCPACGTKIMKDVEMLESEV